MASDSQAALRHLYADHNHWLRNFLHKRLGCVETSADLAQDTFVRLLVREDAGQLRRPRAYLGRIALGLAANHWRRKDIERAYLEALAQQPQTAVPSPETHHLVIETLQRLDTLLRGLPDKVRQAFLLSRLDGLRYRDIANRLDVSERMVKNYMAQAMLHCVNLETEQDHESGF